MHVANEKRGEDLTAFKTDLKFLSFLLHLNAAFLTISLERAEKKRGGGGGAIKTFLSAILNVCNRLSFQSLV